MDFFGMDYRDKTDNHKMKKLKVIWEWARQKDDVINAVMYLDSNLGYKGAMTQFDKLYLYIELDNKERIMTEQAQNIRKNKNYLYAETSNNI